MIPIGSLGWTVRLARVAKGWNQFKLARAAGAGLSVPKISRIESGQRAPTALELKAIARVLKLPASPRRLPPTDQVLDSDREAAAP